MEECEMRFRLRLVAIHLSVVMCTTHCLAQDSVPADFPPDAVRDATAADDELFADDAPSDNALASPDNILLRLDDASSPPPNSKVAIIPLKRISAQQAATTLQELFADHFQQGLWLSGNPTTNKGSVGVINRCQSIGPIGDGCGR